MTCSVHDRSTQSWTPSALMHFVDLSSHVTSGVLNSVYSLLMLCFFTEIIVCHVFYQSVIKEIRKMTVVFFLGAAHLRKLILIGLNLKPKFQSDQDFTVNDFNLKEACTLGLVND